jgi:GT2 family glycosyltransferase
MTDKLRVAPALEVRWKDGRLHVSLGTPGATLTTPDASIVGLLHAFAEPADPDAVAKGSPDAARAIADLAKAGFLVPAESAATTVESIDPELEATVIMPTFEKPAYLDLTLASYLGQTHRAHEIIVIDDGESGATAKVAEKYQASLPLRFLRPGHGGRARARNHGLAVARGKIVVFADDDCVVGPDFVAAHVRAHQRSAEPKIVLGWLHAVVSLLDQKLIGPLYPALRKKLAGGFASIVPLLSADALRAEFESAVGDLALPDADFERKVAPAVTRWGDDLAGLEVAWFLGFTSNMSAPLAMVRQVGCFDPGYVGYGMEDTDLTYSLWQAGARMRVEHAAASYHQVHSRGGVKSEMAETLRYFSRKHDNLDSMLFAAWFTNLLDLEACNAVAVRARENAEDPVLSALVGMLRDALQTRL